MGITGPEITYAGRIGRLGTENAFKMGSHIQQITQKAGPVIRLNLGEPDFNIPPWVKEELHRQIDDNNTHYCDPKGLLSLRTAIAKHAGLMRGLDISPERVVVFPGCKPAIGFAQEVYGNPGDEVIYPTPGFPIYESFTRYLGLIPKPIVLSEEEGFTFTGAQLAATLSPKTRLIFLNFPSNPTGGVATREQLSEIADVILRLAPPDVRVFSDEIYEHILFDGAEHYSIASVPGMAEKTIIASGFSKTYAWTGGRLGYAILPTEEEANTFKNLNINYFSCVPPYNQEGGRIALEHPMAKQHTSKMVAIFQERRDIALERLQQIEGVSCLSPRGAFYLFPNISGMCERLGILDAFERLPATDQEQTSPSTLFQMFALYEHRVAVLDRRSFGTIGSQGAHYLRLSIAADLPLLEEGIRSLAAASVDKKGFARFMKERPDLR